MRRACAAAFAVIMLAGPLAGCGNFQPLYGTSSVSSSVAAELASVAIPEPTTRMGQLIRNDLISTMRPSGTDAPDRYSLAMEIDSAADKEIESSKVQSVVRYAMSVNVAFSLRDHRSGAVVYQGKTFSQVSYDDVGQAFATLQAQNNAMERAAREIALDIRTRLAAHFSAAG